MQHVSARKSHHQATLKPYRGAQSNGAHLGTQRAYNNVYVKLKFTPFKRLVYSYCPMYLIEII